MKTENIGCKTIQTLVKNQKYCCGISWRGYLKYITAASIGGLIVACVFFWIIYASPFWANEHNTSKSYAANVTEAVAEIRSESEEYYNRRFAELAILLTILGIVLPVTMTFLQQMSFFSDKRKIDIASDDANTALCQYDEIKALTDKKFFELETLQEDHKKDKETIIKLNKTTEELNKTTELNIEKAKQSEFRMYKQTGDLYYEIAFELLLVPKPNASPADIFSTDDSLLPWKCAVANSFRRLVFSMESYIRAILAIGEKEGESKTLIYKIKNISEHLLKQVDDPDKLRILRDNNNYAEVDFLVSFLEDISVCEKERDIVTKNLAKVWEKLSLK